MHPARPDDWAPDRSEGSQRAEAVTDEDGRYSIRALLEGALAQHQPPVGQLAGNCDRRLDRLAVRHDDDPRLLERAVDGSSQLRHGRS